VAGEITALNLNTRLAKIRERLLSPLEFVNDVRIVAAWDVVRQARRPFFFFSRMMLAGLVSFQVLWMWSTMFRWRDEAVREGASDLTPAAIAIITDPIDPHRVLWLRKIAPPKAADAA
jgi:hypothetical protein